MLAKSPLPCSQKTPAHHRQSGVVLVVSLIILSLLTLLGLTAVQVSSLEEKIAGNMRAKNTAFQAAEGALQAGEKYIQALNDKEIGGSSIICPAGKNDGLTNEDPNTPVIGAWLKNDDWCDDSTLTQCAFNKQKLDKPRFIVQCLGNKNGLYRITAYAKGTTSDASVILQSVYALDVASLL
jgi:type IV pilus assembly protein PilX